MRRILECFFVFAVALTPSALAHKRPCLSPRLSQSAGRKVDSNSPNSIRRRRTVIIADDEPSVRLLVQATIGTDDYNVLEATDGNEAWSLIQEHRPSLVLLAPGAKHT